MARTRVKVSGVPGLYAYRTTKGEHVYSVNMTVKGVRHSATLRGMKRAEAIEHVRRLRVEAGDATKGVKERIGFSDYLFNKFLPQKRSEGRKVEARMTTYQRFASHFGNEFMDSITSGDVKAYLDSLIRRIGEGKGERLVSARTRGLHKGYLGAIFSEAMYDGFCKENVVRKVRKVKPPAGEEREGFGAKVTRYLTRSEYASLLAVLDEDTGALVMLLTMTGMRLGEAMALRWGMTDPDLQAIHLPGAVCKSGRGRTLDINEAAKGALRHFASLRGAGDILPDDKVKVVAFRRQKVSRYIGGGRTAMTPPESDTLLERFQRERWDQAIRAMGWGAECPTPRLRRFNVHSLRHTCASWLVQGGTPLQVVRDVLGHADMKVTQVYSHLAPEQQRRALLSLDIPAKEDSLDS